jgi:hypothetical protein
MKGLKVKDRVVSHENTCEKDRGSSTYEHLSAIGRKEMNP